MRHSEQLLTDVGLNRTKCTMASSVWRDPLGYNILPWIQEKTKHRVKVQDGINSVIKKEKHAQAYLQPLNTSFSSSLPTNLSHPGIWGAEQENESDSQWHVGAGRWRKEGRRMRWRRQKREGILGVSIGISWRRAGGSSIDLECSSWSRLLITTKKAHLPSTVGYWQNPRQGCSLAYLIPQ